MLSARDAGGWFDHLTAHDLRQLGRAATKAGVDPEDVRRDPAALVKVLRHPSAFDLVFTPVGDAPLPPVSPFLTFALIVHRGWAELQTVGYVREWFGPRQRLPVLGGDDLRDFLASAARRLFLTELLASYTRVSSGSTWVHTRRGWRRRRFSELDPVRLASLLEVVPEDERPGVYRRLGDLALFLTGVFPDHTELHGLSPLEEGRLLRVTGMPGGHAGRGTERTATGTVSLLEQLGERWYGLAARSARPPLTGTMPVVAELAERFTAARRTLNFLTERHLFTHRDTWFPRPAT